MKNHCLRNTGTVTVLLWLTRTFLALVSGRKRYYSVHDLRLIESSFEPGGYRSWACTATFLNSEFDLVTVLWAGKILQAANKLLYLSRMWSGTEPWENGPVTVIIEAWIDAAQYSWYTFAEMICRTDDKLQHKCATSLPRKYTATHRRTQRIFYTYSPLKNTAVSRWPSLASQTFNVELEKCDSCTSTAHWRRFLKSSAIPPSQSYTALLAPAISCRLHCSKKEVGYTLSWFPIASHC